MLRRNLLILLLAAAAVIVLVSLGCDDLVTQTINTTTAGNPTAEFTITPDSGCVPLTVVFDDASSGPVRTWIWNFGDNTMDTVTYADSGDGNVSHTYTEVGSYTVTLSVSDAGDGSDAETKKRAVIVGTNVSRIDLSDTLVCADEEVTFQAVNPYSVTSWTWNFGDGNVSHDDSAVQTHAYSEPGVYQFSLTVQGPCGSSTLIDTVHVLNCGRPLFTVEPASGCIPFTPTFVDVSVPPTDSSGGTPQLVGSFVQWHWNFGNGQVRDAVRAGDTIDDITYNSANSFPVSLTVTTDSGGVITYYDTIITYSSSGTTFSAQPLTGCEIPGRQFVVGFSRTSTGDTAWLWDFGDGFTSTDRSTYHAFTNPGRYTVTLTALGACGEDTTTFDTTITYSDQINQLPAYTFSYSETDSMTVIFVDATPDTAAVETRFWSFDNIAGGAGDSLATKDTIAYQFTSVGSKPVRLTRYNGCDSLWFIDTIVVPEPTVP